MKVYIQGELFIIVPSLINKHMEKFHVCRDLI